MLSRSKTTGREKQPRLDCPSKERICKRADTFTGCTEAPAETGNVRRLSSDRVRLSNCDITLRGTSGGARPSGSKSALEFLCPKFTCLSVPPPLVRTPADSDPPLKNGTDSARLTHSSRSPTWAQTGLRARSHHETQSPTWDQFSHQKIFDRVSKWGFSFINVGPR